MLADLSIGCGKEEFLRKQEAYCEEARVQLLSEEFYGWISLCKPDTAGYNQMKGYAYVSPIGTDSIALHIKSDTTCIDTIIVFPVMCKLVDKRIPCTIFLDPSGYEAGQYSNGNSRIEFSFLFGACKRNSYFDGFGEK